MPTSYDITAYQGLSLDLTVPVVDGSGLPINLSGCSLSGFVKYQYSSTGHLLDLSPAIVAPATSGLVSISIPASGLSSMPIVSAMYDVHLYNSGIVSKILGGYFNVFPEVTI